MLFRIVVLVGVLWVASRASGQELRKWTARAGGFSVEAELIDVSNGNAILKKADNTTISVPLEKLSLSDVRFINGVMREAQNELTKNIRPDKSPRSTNEPAKKEPDAKASVGSESTEESSPPEKEATSSQVPLTIANRSDWQVVPDAKLIKIGNKLSIPIISESGWVEAAYPSIGSPVVAFWLSGFKVGVTTWDLRNGKKIGQYSSDAQTGTFLSHKAVSPDGRSIALASHSGPIEVRSLVAGNRKFDLSSGEGRSHISFMCFLTPDVLLTMDTGSRKLIAWDLKTKKEKYHISSEGNTSGKEVAISAGGNYFAVAGNNAAPIRIYDVRNGALAGQLEYPESSTPGFSSMAGICFSPDGKEFAAMYDVGLKSHIALWDLKEGKFLNSIKLSKSTHSLVMGASRTDVLPLQFLPNSKGWWLFGCAVMDREIGGPVWVDPATKSLASRNGASLVSSDGRVVAVRGQHRAETLVVQSLPWEEIERGKKAVALGGTEEDAKKPQAKIVKPDGPIVPLVASDKWQVNDQPLGFTRLHEKPIGTDLSSFLIDSLSFVGPDRNLGYLLATDQSDGAAFRADGLVKKQIIRFDFTNGKPLPKSALDAVGSYYDFSSSGKLVLVVSGKLRDRVDVYEVESGKHVAGFRPPSDDNSQLMIHWATFVDDSHLLTSRGHGRISVWEIESGKALATMGFAPAISPNQVAQKLMISPSRKALVIATTDGLHVLNPLTLEAIGKLETTPSMRGNWFVVAMSFDPYSNQFAAELSSGEPSPTLAIWNFSDGKLKGEHRLRNRAASITWADRDRVLLHGFENGASRTLQGGDTVKVFDLIDVSRGQMLWRYVIPSGSIIQNGSDGRIWFACSTARFGPAALCSAKLPSPPAMAVIEKLSGPRPLLDKGSQVTLDIRFKPRGDSVGLDLIVGRIRSSLTEQLKKQGFEIDDRSSIGLVVKVDEAFTNRREFTHSRNNVSENRVTCDLSLRDVTGKELWKRIQYFYNDGDRMVEALTPGESLEGRLRAKQWEEVLKWFESPVIPETIYEPVATEGLGESMLGVQGETNIKTF